MNSSLLSRATLPHGLLTPRGLLLRAAILALLFLACHAAGWRDHATVLCGTDPSAAGAHLQAFLGLIYVLAFVGFTAGAPILALGSGCLWLLNRWTLAAPSGRGTGSGGKEMI